MTQVREGETYNGKTRVFAQQALDLHARDPAQMKTVICLMDGEKALRTEQHAWLPRAIGVLDIWARREGAASYGALDANDQAALAGRMSRRIRENTYDPATGTITLEPDRVVAISNAAAHYESLFGNDPASQELREAYAMKNDTVPDEGNRRALTAFFWWTA